MHGDGVPTLPAELALLQDNTTTAKRGRLAGGGGAAGTPHHNINKITCSFCLASTPVSSEPMSRGVTSSRLSFRSSVNRRSDIGRGGEPERSTRRDETRQARWILRSEQGNGDEKSGVLRDEAEALHCSREDATSPTTTATVRSVSASWSGRYCYLAGCSLFCRYFTQETRVYACVSRKAERGMILLYNQVPACATAVRGITISMQDTNVSYIRHPTVYTAKETEQQARGWLLVWCVPRDK